jgi:cytochrome c oxidase subunit 2
MTMAALILAAGASAAWAADPQAPGYALPGQIDFQTPASDHAVAIQEFHNLLLVIITIVAGFVLALLAWVIIRYNAKANPKPSTFSHNMIVEVIWTAVPVVILVLIFLPSMRVLYDGDIIPPADMTIKAIGHQWNWSYEYPDHGNITFFSKMLDDKAAAAANEPRLLAVDNRVVVPVGKVVRVIVTSEDVIHSWALPAFGVKIDGVPGRLNETWFKANREGIFYGQCSELCGVDHARMPIAVEVVSQEKFDEWVAKTKTAAEVDREPAALAAAR